MVCNFPDKVFAKEVGFLDLNSVMISRTHTPRLFTLGFHSWRLEELMTPLSSIKGCCTRGDIDIIGGVAGKSSDV